MSDEGRTTFDIPQFLKKYKVFKSLHDDRYKIFEKYVYSDPLAASKYAHSILDHSVDEQHEFLSGIRESIYESQELDWKSMLDLIERLVNNKAEERLLLNACGILERGLEYNLVSYMYKERVWNLVRKILMIVEGHSKPDIKFDPNVGSLTYSINYIDGMSFHVLFRYLEWCNANEKSNNVFKNIKKILEAYKNRPEYHTITRHGAIGFFFKLLFSIDKHWALDLLDSIFSKAPHFKIYFWSSYVWSRPMHQILIELRSIYDEFLNSKITSNMHDTMLYRDTIEHVVLGYFYGFENFLYIFKYII